MFERLIANYLVKDPQYGDLLQDVWLWEEWPDRWGADVGIDLVARERATGDYWAIQCKFYDPAYTIQKADIDSFLSASGKQFATGDGSRHFARRIVVSTTDRWNRNAESAIEGQSIPVSRIGLSDLAESPIDWTEFSLSRPDLIRLRPKKTPLPHQEEAIEAVIDGFKEADRGKLIMAFGTGKTFTSLKLAEKIVPTGGRILFLAPSISLVAQTLREWTAQAEDRIHAFVVCSDSKVGRDEEDLRTHDLAYPATTDAGKLAHAASRLGGERRVVVFSTYQSVQVVADAQRAGLGDFDLIICDEAHRTTGLTLPGEDPSDFVKVHGNANVCGKRRLYMTATPRIYAEASKTKAGENDAVLYSMDDEETFGKEFYRLGFGKAVERDLLADYKVLIVAVEQDKMGDVANRYNRAYKLDERKAIDISFATKIIGSWKGLSKQGLVLIGEDGEQEALSEDTDPMRRAVAFSRSIAASKQMTEVFSRLAELYSDEEFRRRYAEPAITKEDIFWYVYGILHSPEYKDRFASDLKKMIPRIPFAADFFAFRDAGRELGRWHLNYEAVEPWPLEEDVKRLVMEPDDWRVHKMVFGKRGRDKDRSVIVYNANVTLKGIPDEAYDYVVNGKSAIEWVMERYQLTVHKDSGIRNDPNDWSEDPRYIVDLLKRIVRVSVETARIVRALPPLDEQA